MTFPPSTAPPDIEKSCTIPVALFRNKLDKEPSPAEWPWERLVQRLTQHALRPTKDGPAFSPVRYRDGEDRGNDGVECVACYVADIDDGTGIADLIDRWQNKHGEALRYACYSTFQSTAARPRWRVVFPLTRFVPADEWLAVWRKLTAALTGGHCDPSTKDQARLSYLPACPPASKAEAFWESRDGALLDPEDYPDPPQEDLADRMAATMRRRDQRDGVVVGAGQGRPGEDYSARATVEEVVSLLEKDGWRVWKRRGHAVYMTRPGKADDVSGVVGFPDDPAPVFYCFTSSSTSFDGGKPYSAFSVYGLIEHKGDFKAAARTLGKQGYGEQPADRIGKSAAKAASAAAGKGGSSKNGAHKDVPEIISEPAGRNEKGLLEYAPYQIGQILGLETQAPDTNAALAFRAAKAFKSDLCHCRELGWLHWDGKQWLVDDKENSRTAALFVTLSKVIRQETAKLFRLVSDLLQQGRTEDGAALERAGRAHLRHIKMVESEPFAQRAMVLARSAMKADVKQFETRPWLLGFLDGVWDKGQWREHRREDYLLDLCPVRVTDMLGQSHGADWSDVLDRITGGDADYAHTLQDVAGYALSGASHLRILPWAYGPTGTGKSTIAELLMVVLGNSAASIDSKLLGSDAPRERLGANMWGKRMIVCAEAGNQRIDAELLKTLSGADGYPVRFHYKEAFTAKPTHVLLMTANDAPTMNAYDLALKDRVLALPFRHQLAQPAPLCFDGKAARIEAVRQDTESSLVRGFTQWAIEGLDRVYHTQSVYQSERVRTETERFWRDTDPLTAFWESVKEGALREGITRSDLRSRFLQWCDDEGIKRPIGPQLFTQACQSAGLYDTRIGNVRGWILKGPWQFTYTSYTSEPVSDKTSRESIKTRDSYPENTPGSVRSVHGDVLHTTPESDWEEI